MQSHNLFWLIGPPFGRCAAAVIIAGFLMASNAFAAPASIILPGDRVFPENITSTKDGTLYVGSLGSGGIFRIKPGATKADLWIKPGAFGSRSIFGVLADERSNTLWACSNDMSALGVVIASTENGSVLKGFDLKTGQGKVSAKLPGDHTFCNDIAIGADGSAFVTNTAAPEILRLPPGRSQLEVWANDPLLAPPAGGSGLDGIAFGSDGNVYVDTYTPGELFRVDVVDGNAGKVTKLRPSRPLTLSDAIRPLGGNEFLIIEGAGRLDRMRIQGDNAVIETLKDGYVTPTGVTVIGHTAWVSEGQLAYVFDPAKRGQSPNVPFHIYSVPMRSN
jgi:outer membrane protein assembly factor BamB